jgi:GntR family transcriptional regulator/MocR family aminotransferase
MRMLYGERRSLLIKKISERFRERMPVVGDNAGLHLVLELPADADDRQVTAEALSRGIIVRPLTSYYSQANAAHPGLLLGYGCVTTEQICPAFERLESAIETSLGCTIPRISANRS